MMLLHSNFPDSFHGRRLLHHLITSQQITFAGNRRLKIYGALTCASGKSMKRNNRVFFSSEQEALTQGYRPCGHCMKEKYKKWKGNR